jgi:hypothetical protein
MEKRRTSSQTPAHFHNSLICLGFKVKDRREVRWGGRRGSLDHPGWCVGREMSFQQYTELEFEGHEQGAAFEMEGRWSVRPWSGPRGVTIRTTSSRSGGQWAELAKDTQPPPL